MKLDTKPQPCQLSIDKVGRTQSDIDCGCYTDPWFCVRTAPKAEYHAFLGLGEIGFRAYLPQIVVRRIRYQKPETSIRPMFPSYLFVTFDPAAAEWGAIYRTKGVSRLFTTVSGQPASIRDGSIERLMAKGRAGDGVIDDEAPSFPRIAPGDAVRIVEGPFADWSGVCQWSTDERIGVLMTLFNAERVVPMALSAVEVGR